MSFIYLAGGMSGYTFKEANAWRKYMEEQLTDTGITCLSPMRGLEFLDNDDQMECHFEDNILSSQQGIITRDYLDIVRSDAIIVNFLGAKQISIGTVWEMGAAYALKKPVILIMEKEGNLHNHAMLLETARYGYHTDNLDEAVYLIQTLLHS